MVTLRIGSCLFLLVTFCGAPTLVAAAGTHDSRPVLTGIVTRVIDADTIDVKLTSGPIRVRFHGIDAPERGQPGGAEATAALKRWILDKEVDLEPSDQSRSYDRLVATVYHGETNINARLVREGYAWADPRYLGKVDALLCHDEANARAAKRGLWSLPPDARHAPWEYRRRKTLKQFTDYSRRTAAQCIAAIGKR